MISFHTAQDTWTPTDATVLKFPTCAQVNAQTIQKALAEVTDTDLDVHIKGCNDLVARKRREYNDAIAALADALNEKEARHG